MRPSAASSADAEMPKSMISACSSSPAPPIMMLAGFRSRWTTPASCAASSPPAIWRASRSARADRQLAVAPQHRRQVVALDVRHRDVLDAVDLAEVVNADDVLVRDLAGEQQLVLEALFRRRQRDAAPPVRANHLQRDRDAQLRVPGLVDRAHAADAEDPDDVIARAERLPDPERPRGFERRRAHFGGSRRAGGRRGAGGFRSLRSVGTAGGRGERVQAGGRAEGAVRREAGRVDRDDAGRDAALGKRRPASGASAAERRRRRGRNVGKPWYLLEDTGDYRRGGRPLPREIGERPPWTPFAGQRVSTGSAGFSDGLEEGGDVLSQFVLDAVDRSAGRRRRGSGIRPPIELYSRSSLFW